MGWAFHRMTREEEEREKKYSDLTLFKRLFHIFGYYKTETISVIAIVLTVSIFSSSIPILMQQIIDMFIKPGTTDFTNQIIIMGACYLVFIILNFFLILARTVFFAKLGQKLIYRIRNDLFTKLQYLSFEHFEF